jgi:hypothetical protein
MLSPADTTPLPNCESFDCVIRGWLRIRAQLEVYLRLKNIEPPIYTF